MKLIMTFGGRNSAETWTDNSSRFLTEKLINGKKIGYRSEIITCREVICNRIREAKDANTNLLLFGNLNRGLFTPEIQVKEVPKVTVDNFFRKFNLEDYFTYSKYYFLKGLVPDTEPAVYSAMALLIKNYSMYFENSNAYQISLAILKNILSSTHTCYRTDYIFTAYFVYLLLDTDYRMRVRNYFFTNYWVNGPGQFIHKNLSIFMNVKDNEGYNNAINWWKEGEVNSTLTEILSRHKFEFAYEKIIRMLMEK